MRSYGVLVGGVERPGVGWVYSPRVSSLIEDPLGVLALKAALEEGQELSPGRAIVGRVAVAGPAQVQEALRAARTAQPAWAKVPLVRRLEFLLAVHHAFRDRFEELVEILVEEGHPTRLARWEVSGMITLTSELSLSRAASLMDLTDECGAREVRLVRKADGVVCLSPPQNAALSNGAMGLWALAAGNALVVGAPRSGPLGISHLYTRIVAPLLARFDAPPGILSVTCAPTKDLLAAWMSSDDVDDIYYFGSADHGRQVLVDCVANGKKPVLELSGNDGVIIWKDAEVDLAAQALAECFYGSGQICMVPRYAVVHPDIADQVVDALVVLAEKSAPALPEDESTVASPVLRAPQFLEAVAQLREHGGQILTGGYMSDLRGQQDEQGLFAAPTVARIDGVGRAAQIPAVVQETFFPLMCIVIAEPGDDEQILADAIAFLNANTYGLRNSLWAQDPRVVSRVCAEVGNGGLLKINDSHIGFVPGLPSHGGTGLTGGPFGEGAFPITQTSHLQGISDATGLTPRSAVFSLP